MRVHIHAFRSAPHYIKCFTAKFIPYLLTFNLNRKITLWHLLFLVPTKVLLLLVGAMIRRDSLEREVEIYFNAASLEMDKVLKRDVYAYIRELWLCG
jgi:hypothetical protein